MDCKHGVGVALYGGDMWCEHCGALRKSGSSEWIAPRPDVQGPDPDEKTIQNRERGAAQLERVAARIRAGDHLSYVGFVDDDSKPSSHIYGPITSTLCIALQAVSRRASAAFYDSFDASLFAVADAAEREASGPR